MTVPPPSYGVVHGRFQPFHRGHLEYLDLVVSRCDTLVVGITNPDPGAWHPEADSAHRHQSEANPFTFLERLRMVLGSLEELSRQPLPVWVVPFPVHEPERLPDYVPPDATHFVRVFSRWEEVKVARLRQCGLRVEPLPTNGIKRISGMEVRARLRERGNWESLVPRGTAQVIHELLDARFPVC